MGHVFIMLSSYPVLFPFILASRTLCSRHYGPEKKKKRQLNNLMFVLKIYFLSDSGLCGHVGWIQHSRTNLNFCPFYHLPSFFPQEQILVFAVLIRTFMLSRLGLYFLVVCFSFPSNFILFYFGRVARAEGRYKGTRR